MSFCTQLKTIPIPTDTAVSYSKILGLVEITGSVTLVDHAHNYFCLTPAQFVSGSTQNDAVFVCAVMNRNMPFCPNSLKFPEINCLVNFTGRLHLFEADPKSSFGNSRCAKVSVDMISKISDIADSSASNKQGEVCNVADDNNAISLKDQVCKYTDNTSIKQGNTLSCEKESSVGTSKGKHKVTLSLEGLASGKAEYVEKKHK
jgi:hypothetical protein